MSKKPTPEQVMKRAAEIIAHQLSLVIDLDPVKGPGLALTLVASSATAVVDQCDNRPAAWQYFDAKLELAKEHGEAISQQLDEGVVDVEVLAMMTKPGGKA